MWAIDKASINKKKSLSTDVKKTIIGYIPWNLYESITTCQELKVNNNCTLLFVSFRKLKIPNQ
jgi:hypothetical protein